MIALFVRLPAAVAGQYPTPILADPVPGSTNSTTGTSLLSAAPGNPYPWEGAVAGVKTGNGNKQTVIPLFSWTARGGMQVAFNLYHNSMGGGAFIGEGGNWRFSYDSYVVTDSNNDATIMWEDGRAVTFKCSGGMYVAPPGEFGILGTVAGTVSSGFVYVAKNKIKYTFAYVTGGGGGGNPEYCGLTSVTDLNGNTITVNRSSALPYQGEVTSIVDPTGRTITLNFARTNNLYFEPFTPPGGTYRVATSTRPTASGWSYLNSITDPSGRVWPINMNCSIQESYQLVSGVYYPQYSDANADIQAITWPQLAGTSTTYSDQFLYNSADAITSFTDRKGATTTIAYYPYNNGSSGVVSSITDPCGNTTSFQYNAGSSDGVGNTVVTDPNGNVTASYYANGTITSVVDPTGASEQYVYDANQDLKQRTDRRGHVWTYTYDTYGNTWTASDPDGHTTTNTYNSFNEPLTSTDWLHHETSFAYDTYGNLTSVTDPLGHTTTTTIPANNCGLPTALTDALGHAIKLDTYDANGYLKHTTDANNLGSGTTVFNSLGWVTSFTGVNGTVTADTYDTWGRCTSITVTPPSGSTFVPATSTSSTSYDPDDCVLTSTDADDFITTFTYDEDDRVLTRTAGNGDVVRYTYDGVYNGATQKGLLSYVTNGNGKTTYYEYTVRNAPRVTHYPDGTAESVTYDPDGNMASHTTRNGITKTYVFDNEDRVTQIIHPSNGYLGSNANATTPFTLNYTGVNGSGNLVLSMTDVTGATSWTYDAAGRLSQLAVSRSDGNATLGYTYDNADRLTQAALNAANGAVNGWWTYGYDNGDRVLSVTTPTGGTAAYTYNNLDQVTQKTNGNGTFTTYWYDALGDMGEVHEYKSDGVTQLNWAHFMFSGAGRLTGRTDSTGAWTAFGYDGAGQLTVEDKASAGGTAVAGSPVPPLYEIEYAYDHNGNRTSRTYFPNAGTSGITDTYTIDPNTDRLTSVSYGAGGNRSYTYDNDGNLTQVDENGVPYQSMTYDYEDRMLSLNPYNSALTTSAFNYQYNVLGQRTSAQDRYGSVPLVYSSPDPGASLLWDSRALYTPGVGEFRANQSNAGVNYYYGLDGQGSVTTVSDGNQNTAGAVMDDAFGNPIAGNGPFLGAGNTLFFGMMPTTAGWNEVNGYQNDQDTGYYYVGNRYYDPTVGRFISTDPAGAGTNWYAYCGSDPLNATDPTGLDQVQSLNAWWANVGSTYTDADGNVWTLESNTSTVSHSTDASGEAVQTTTYTLDWAETSSAPAPGGSMSSAPSLFSGFWSSLSGLFKKQPAKPATANPQLAEPEYGFDIDRGVGLSRADFLNATMDAKEIETKALKAAEEALAKRMQAGVTTFEEELAALEKMGMFKPTPPTPSAVAGGGAAATEGAAGPVSEEGAAPEGGGGGGENIDKYDEDR
jgi:RHS repeat-associated protein